MKERVNILNNFLLDHKSKIIMIILVLLSCIALTTLATGTFTREDFKQEFIFSGIRGQLGDIVGDDTMKDIQSMVSLTPSITADTGEIHSTSATVLGVTFSSDSFSGINGIVDIIKRFATCWAVFLFCFALYDLVQEGTTDYKKYLVLVLNLILCAILINESPKIMGYVVNLGNALVSSVNGIVSDSDMSADVDDMINKLTDNLLPAEEEVTNVNNASFGTMWAAKLGLDFKTMANSILVWIDLGIPWIACKLCWLICVSIEIGRAHV